MMVFVNGRFLARRPTGVDRFAFEVTRAMNVALSASDLASDITGLEVLVPIGPELPRTIDGVRSRSVGKLAGQLWEQLEFPRAVDSSSVALSLCNTGPIFLRRHVVVIHDAATVAVPSAFSRTFRWWYRALMPLLGRVSRRVLTVSDFSAREIAVHFGISSDRISVVSEGGEHILREPSDSEALARFGLVKRPFVLAVSSMAAHKNFQLVLDAVGRLDDPPFDIAIAGGANARVFGTAGNVTSDRIKWLGYVSDAELRALYESAMCFVFPSLYEGFGIPPLEAMNCGCPVLAARAASIPEVCGDAALYFDPRSPEELAELLTRVAANQELRADLAARGRVQAARFSLDKAARQVLAACREAMQ